tara:strand:- start:351 stop:563 length:213 start_codon:yes stop_codon:yes gene_type:complete
MSKTYMLSEDIIDQLDDIDDILLDAKKNVRLAKQMGFENSLLKQGVRLCSQSKEVFQMDDEELKQFLHLD